MPINSLVICELALSCWNIGEDAPIFNGELNLKSGRFLMSLVLSKFKYFCSVILPSINSNIEVELYFIAPKSLQILASDLFL